MVQVSLKRWSELGETERKIARKLGITPKESQQPEKRSSHLHVPKPCIIRAKVTCNLCSSKTTQYFHMQLRENASLPYLQSVEITEQRATRLAKAKGVPERTQDVEQSTCTVCPKVLSDWTKEELVLKLIEVFPVARAAAITGGKPHSRRW